MRERLAEERTDGQRSFSVDRSSGERPESGEHWRLSLKGRAHPGHRVLQARIKAGLTCLELGQPFTLYFAQAYQALTY